MTRIGSGGLSAAQREGEHHQNCLDRTTEEPQQGTGHAVQCAREALAGFDGSVLVCYGDMPLMRRATYESLIETHKREVNDCTLLSAVSDEE
ncbi:NTP transferase domain-containing protein, partial [Flavonifractor plautii]